MDFDPACLSPEERSSMRLRALYRQRGYTQYRMSKFEEYDLYAQNKDFLVSNQVITFTDLTGKLMALKPDVTLSILKNSKPTPRELHKFYYDEQVYRIPKAAKTYKEIRQVGLEQGSENCCYIHVVLVPYISGSDEYKSKPAQHSCKELQGMGIAPNIIVLRADGPVGADIKRKISMFCNVRPDCVIENLTMPSLYECPLMLEAAGLTNVVCRQLHLETPASDLTEWKELISRIATRSKTCTIALVGKYVKLHDAYLSVMESLYHAGFENESKVEIHWVDSENLLDQERCAEELSGVDGIILPGGFGDRGIEGMIQAARYAREQNIPYFGICLGMQIMVMEYARDVLGYADANSSEFTPDGEHNVIALMPDQQGNIPKGGTMRLGKYPCITAEGTKLRECYGKEEIDERHRHRYEFNNDYRAEMQNHGLVISGTSPDGRLVEAVELPGRDFHVGVQFHPEFKSRPNRAHPLFKGFIAAALKYQQEHTITDHQPMAD